MGEYMRLSLSLFCGGAIAVALSFGSARLATADQCNFASPRDPQIDLARKDGPVRIDNSRTRKDLQRMQIRAGRSTAFGAGWTPVGLTLTELKYNMRVSIEALKLGPSSYCARLTGVQATLGYDKFDVYIARKFRPGSCAHRSVREHEMTHVSVFLSGLNEFYPRMRHRIERATGSIGTIKAANPNAAARRLQARLRDAINPLFKEMNRTLDRRNRLLDTPERYRSEQARCTDW